MLDSNTSGDTGDDGGWTFVADSDDAAELLATLVELDDDTYTRSELSERSGVPLKTLYLDDLIGEFVDLGVLSRVDSPTDGDDQEGEPEYSLERNSALLDAAAAFDDAYRTQTE